MAYTLLDKIYFIGEIYNDCSKVSQESGISLDFIMAQTALETGWGRSVLPGTNNLFNIKADSSWTGPTATFTVPEYINGEWVNVESKFRVYNSYEESIKDWLDFLQNNPRYSEVFDPNVKGDLNKIAQAMKDAGYATDPNYVSKIIGVANGKTMKKALSAGSVNNLPLLLSNLAIKAIRSIFTASKYTESPIILDLDKDGVETTALTSGTYFDHDANGFAEQTGWVDSGDGLLAIDRNNDGQINNGTELFGNNTLLSNGTNASNGFQALAELDTNTDGKIDINDSAYNQLRIWQDIDEDGYTSQGELKTLEELGIASINTGYTNLNTVDANGNEHKQVSSFTWNDGTTNEATDVWFKQDKMFTIANDWVEVPDDIAALPDLQGFGNVYDLHQAMARERQEAIGTGQEEKLKSLIEQFAAATDVTTRNSLIDQILYRWTGSENIYIGARGVAIDARKLAVLENFFGEQFLLFGSTPYPGQGAADVLMQAYNGIYEITYGQLMAQTNLKDIFSSITYTWDETTQSVRADLNAVQTQIQNLLTTDYSAGKQTLSDIVRTIKGLGAQEMMNYTAFENYFIQQSSDLKWTIDTAGKTVVCGTTINDSLVGTFRPDYIVGGEGNDTIYGGADNDVLDGGSGNDYLAGCAGNDTYKFGIGSGQDTINNDDWKGTETDIIEFGPGITTNDLELIKQGSDLKIAIKGTEDTLTIYNWFAGPNYKIEQFKFTDGTILTPAEIDAIGYKMYGTTASDSLLGSNANDTIYGNEGNDNLYGYEGADTLYGGLGNDNLRGGAGDDTYIYNLGDGSDTIYDYESTSEGCNTIQFGPGITANDLEFIKSGTYDLKIKINGTSDILTITSWFYADSYKIGKIKFADGSEKTLAEIEAGGYKIYGTSANESLAGSNAKDILDGGAGNDNLQGGLGNDTYKFGIGSGTDTINDYDTTSGNIDTIEFGAGITANDVEFTKNNSNLKILINGQTDTLIIQSWFNGSNPNAPYRIENFRFADGTTLTINDLEQAGYKMYGTAGSETLGGSNAKDEIYGYASADYLYGYAGGDTINGGAGADILYGGDGNDTLNGEADNDTLAGEAGDDLLDGGTGNDNLQGGLGNDTYKFGIGDGQDTINDYATDNATTTDTVQMGANSLNLILTKTSNNLTITNNTNTDQITMQSWYSGAAYQTEEIQTADGKHLHNNQVAQLIQAMATFCTTNGVTWNQAIEQKPAEVQQVLAQYWSQT